MNDFIRGIKGGGYHPEANFSVWDLPDAAELIAKKPGLAGDNIGKYVEDIGIDDTLEMKLNRLIVPKLKEMLKQNKLKVNGKKKDLIDRIIKNNVPLLSA